MAKKLNSALGIDIGSKTIKVAEIKSQGNQPVVTALGMIETPKDSVDHTGVYNPDLVGVAIKQVLSEAGASVSQAVVSIAGQASVLVRTLEVPRMNEAELKEHMQWEISRNIPFAESTVQSDFKMLDDDDPNSQNVDVVMAISPQSAIDTIVAAMKKAGKQVAAIDVEPMGMARSLVVSGDASASSQIVCMVEIGHKTTAINIFKGGKLLMPRQVPIGGEMFTQELAKNLGVTEEEAEQIKISRAEIPGNVSSEPPSNPFSVPGPVESEPIQPYNPFGGDVPQSESFGEPAPPPPMPVDNTPEPIGDPETVRIYNAMVPILEEFVGEVRRSLDYFRSKGGEVDRVVLCGGGANLKGLVGYLGRSLGLTCAIHDPLRNVSVNAKKASPDFVEAHREEFAVAVGNGLHILF